MEDNNEPLPQDVQNEILLRLPVKSLGKCICVSKKWAALIREKYFKDRYLLQSMSRPRLLFVFARIDADTNVLFHSVYQEKERLLSSSGQQQTSITPHPKSHICAVTRGLVCIIQSKAKVVLCNPGTKKFLSLPEIQDRSIFLIKTYLGFDEATDVFKVLCLTTKNVDNTLYTNYRVFTVGSGEDCWRKIVCKTLHFPVTQGLSKDGVLYYGALSSGNDSLVMSFKLMSEEFNVIELPNPIQIHKFDTSLVNYNGEFALVNGLVCENGEIRIWIRNETVGDWREEHIVIPRWREAVGVLCKAFSFKGTIGTGEFVFVLVEYVRGLVCVLYYDRITQHLKKFEIDGVASDTFHYFSTFLDHVDSLPLM